MTYNKTAFNTHQIILKTCEYKGIFIKSNYYLDLYDEVTDWLDENTPEWSNMYIGGEIIFEFDTIDQAMAFKLRWT